MQPNCQRYQIEQVMWILKIEEIRTLYIAKISNVGYYNYNEADLH
jgi:hypothetical protein